MIKLRIMSADKKVKFRAEGEVIDTLYDGAYEDGDFMYVELSERYVKIKLDENLKESIVYVPNKVINYKIPCDKFLDGYHPEAFQGESHKIYIAEIEEEEFYGKRNIALNSHDQRFYDKCFPHAAANFVTRQDPVFFERNAIDGVCDNVGHGKYPYLSWAAGAREDLDYFVYFGTEVEVSEFKVFLRADFPHDTYWKAFDIEFSDKSLVHADFKESAEGQVVKLEEPKKTEYIHITNFKQAADPLSWAALCQIEVYGNYIKKEIETMEVRNASNSRDVKHYTTERLREEFLIQDLFTKDNIRMVYSHIDRIITCGMMPVKRELKLEAGKELAAEYFLQRREMGCINIGGRGVITVDGVDYEMNPRDGIYIGMGNKDITFKSVDEADPAKFYISSCPAHKEYPIVKIDITKAKKVPCGSVEDCNKRVINQYIHPEVMKSCQLSMGLTQLEPGSNWNTMPCHTHDRRMEVYLYLDMGENDAVFHMMGEPDETRHIIMHNEEAVISPSWSIHSGVGTKAYSFIWAMCGENQEFTDMDHIETRDLR